MKFSQYVKEATERLNPAIANSRKEQLTYSKLILIEEQGEIAAEIRKPFYKGNFHEKTFSITHTKEELGDVLWGVALYCKAKQIDTVAIEKKIQNVDKEKNNVIQLPNKEVLTKIMFNVEEKVDNMIKSNKKEQNAVISTLKSIEEFATELGSNIEELMAENIQKCNKRYNENGCRTNQMQMQEEARER